MLHAISPILLFINKDEENENNMVSNLNCECAVYFTF